VLQSLAEISPDNILKLASGDVPGAAPLWRHKGAPLHLARARIVIVPGGQMTATAGPAAVAAADQTAQQIRMHAVVPPRQAAVIRQPLVTRLTAAMINHEMAVVGGCDQPLVFPPETWPAVCGLFSFVY
jgi:hypothetical protein